MISLAKKHVENTMVRNIRSALHGYERLLNDLNVNVMDMMFVNIVINVSAKLPNVNSSM
jgi:hypothetical protein